MMISKTNADHNPPKIEDLGDGTFYYNFNIEKKSLKREGSYKKYNSWYYDQVRLDYPVSKTAIQQKVDDAGYSHTVKIKK